MSRSKFTVYSPARGVWIVVPPGRGHESHTFSSWARAIDSVNGAVISARKSLRTSIRSSEALHKLGLRRG
jgi:hypothetical protein